MIGGATLKNEDRKKRDRRKTKTDWLGSISAKLKNTTETYRYNFLCKSSQTTLKSMTVNIHVLPHIQLLYLAVERKEAKPEMIPIWTERGKSPSNLSSLLPAKKEFCCVSNTKRESSIAVTLPSTFASNPLHSEPAARRRHSLDNAPYSPSSTITCCRGWLLVFPGTYVPTSI
jgi:hypothetical protein